MTTTLTLIRAFIAGLSGAIMMSLAMFVLRSLGFHISLEALLGSMIDSSEGVDAWNKGLLIHLAIGTVVGVLYALAFEAVGRSGVLLGAGLGLANGLASGMLMTAIPAMNPVSPSLSAAAPGPFLSHVPYGPVMFLAVHVVYGLTVGAVYSLLAHRPAMSPKHVH